MQSNDQAFKPIHFYVVEVERVVLNALAPRCGSAA
jgi:hypothetical protein